MNKKFFVIMMCCSLAVLMCCCLSVYGAFSLKCPSCGSTRVRTYTQSSANGHVATTVCNKCNTVVLRGNVVAHKWNTLHTCTVCGYRGSHRYSAKVLKEATCTSEGVRKYTCECGAEFEEKLVMLKHVFIYQNGTKNEKTHLLNCKNCTATRNETHKMSNNRCTVCGYEEVTVQVCSHTWKAATCTTPKTCTKCGETEGEALGHSYKYNGGLKTGNTHRLVCERCNASRTETHKMSNNRCTVCGYEEVTVQVCSHTWKAATCTTPKTCTKCGETEGEALGHSYKYNGGLKTGNTHRLVCERCNASRTETHKMSNNRCTVCGYEEVTVQVCSHTWKAATCTTPKTCTKCGETEGEALGHSYKYNGGLKTGNTHRLVCERCNASRTETHKMSNNRCTVCGYEEVTVQVCSHTWKAATCTTPKTCTKCGETEGEALGHSYKYNGGLKTGNTHRLVCERCNASRTETHKMSNNRCTVCGYEKIIIEEPKKCSHKYIYSNISEEKHSVKCTKCDYYQEENHEFDSSNRCKKCYATRKCNKDYTVPGHPIFVDKYEMTNDTETHKVTKRCVACNITFEYTEKHSFNIDGVCVSCGYKNAVEQKCKLGRILEGHNPVKTEKQTKIDSKVHRIYYYCDICDRTFSENVSHTFVNGICSCGYTEDDFVCQHDSKNYKITYSKTNDINKHIKKIVCKECNAQVEIREGHTFLNKKCECGVEFSMRIQMDTTSLAKGETVQIKVIHNGDSNITFGYTSSNTNLIEVNDSGLVKAVEDSNISNRDVTITVKAYASNQKELAKQDIKIKYNPGYALNVNIPSQAYLGEEVELTAIASKDIGDGYIKWNIEGVGDINQVKDSNSIKCIFNKAGQIKCQVTIYKNSSAVARETRTVKVIERKTKTPTREMSIFLDDSVILANIENLTIEDGNSVKVSGNAVTGVSLGVTRVKDEKGNTYNINVTNKIIPITDIKVELGRTDNIIFKDEQVQANIITIPQNATEEITIKSSNSSIPVTNGGLITAKSVGKTTITISTPSGKKIEQKIEVKAEDLKLEGKKGKIEVDLASKTINLPVDKSLLSEKTLSTLKYTSSNNEIATVSDDGVVKLLKMGNVTIKVNATLLNGKTTKEVKQKISIMNYTRVKFVKDGKNYGYDMKAGTDENSNKIYVYFGGSGSITGGVNASANKKIKDSTYSGDVLVAMGTGDIGTFAEWDPTIPAMAELLSSDKYADKEIILIGYSSGGYSAAETALGLAEKGKTNVTLYIVDGVQGARGKNQFEEYEKLDAAGVDTTIYSSSDTRDISKNTRAVGEEFAKKEGSNIKYVKDEDNMSHGDIKDFAQDLIDK